MYCDKDGLENSVFRGTQSNVSSRHLALIHLSRIMDSGSEAAKIAILTRLGQIQIGEDDSYLKQIINKGKSDSNYLVRFVAAREDGKTDDMVRKTE